jgi:hypothetical protein
MYDASNRKDIRRAEKRAAIAERARINFLCAAMSRPEGRAWYHDFLESCHLFSDPFSGDALREAYLKGERNIGLKVFADIHAHCPDKYIQMMKEANNARSTDPGAADLDDDPDTDDATGLDD